MYVVLAYMRMSLSSWFGMMHYNKHTLDTLFLGRASSGGKQTLNNSHVGASKPHHQACPVPALAGIMRDSILIFQDFIATNLFTDIYGFFS